MTDPTPTEPEIPEELPEPEPQPEILEPAPEPSRKVFVQMQFSADGVVESSYGSTLELPIAQTSETYARQIAEVVERTSLLHFGALPVLKKLEVGA